MTTLIDTLPVAPDRSMSEADFRDAAEAWTASWNTRATQSNTQAAENNANAVSAAASAASAISSAAVAAGAANNKGNWSALAGALALPASCVHNGQVWILNSATASVAADQPGISSKWTQLYPPKRYPIFSASTVGKNSDTTGEMLQNAISAAGLTNLAGITGNATIGLIAWSANSTNQVSHSMDGGRTWNLRTMPITTNWTVTSTADRFVAVVPTSPGQVYVSTNGVAWGSSITLTGVATNGAYPNLAAGMAGKVIIAGSSTYNAVSTDNAATFNGPTFPVAFGLGVFFSAGLFVGYSAASTYYTSTTGNSGSWTARTLPNSCDKMAQDTNGDLLAWVFTSLAAPIYRSTDGGLTWASTGITPAKASTQIRSLNGVLFQASSASGAYTHHGKQWVWRTAPFDMTSGDRFMAMSGTALVIVQAGGSNVYIIDPGAADAITGLWE